MTSKTVLQSALAQWEALENVTEAARQVLPEEESRALNKVTTNGATRTLECLDEHRRKYSTSTSAPERGEDVDDEPTEIRNIRSVLQQAAAGGE